MPRIARQLADESCYHVLARGNNRKIGDESPTFPVVCILTLLVGCSYSTVIHRPGFVMQRDSRQLPIGVSAPPINLVLKTQRTTYHGQSAPMHYRVISGWKARRAFDRAVKEFPFLANAKVESPGAQYSLAIEAVDAIRTSVLRDALAGLSFFLIPNRMEWSFHLKADLFERTRILGNYESEGRCTIYEHLIFLPMSLRSLRIAAQVRQDTFRDLFLQIEQDSTGEFGKSEASRIVPPS